MVNCQGCGEETLSRLCCPKCSEYGRTSFFCSQDCFVNSWPSHSKLHVIIRQVALSNSSSSYDGSSLQNVNADETAIASPATTAASVSANGEEGYPLSKTVQPLYAGAYASEPRSRSRTLSRAGSDTELPVVTSSSASSSSFSHVSSAVTTSSSASSSSRRGPPTPSPVGVAAAAADKETTGHSGATPNANRESTDDHDSAAGGVLTAVRSLLLPKTTRERTEDMKPGSRSASSAPVAAAVRVTHAMQSVFSTSHNRHHVVPCNNRKKDVGRAVPRRDASGRTGAAMSSAAVPPAGLGFCRCVVLGVICTFSLCFMWLMRRVLFDAGGSLSSAYYTTRSEEVTPNKGEALSDTDDIISAVLARIGARPYGEEISALQASVQDIRNELAAVTTLVQQHGAVIDQFIDKPNFSGRRQGGAGGAINQAISAFLEGGPPSPDTPQLKLPALRRPSGGFGHAKGAAAAGLSEKTTQQNAETMAIDETENVVGMHPQKFYEANVAVEGGDRDKIEAAGQQQQPPSGNTHDEQLQRDGRQEHPSEGVGDVTRSSGVSDDDVYLAGSLVNVAVKSASRLGEPESGRPSSELKSTTMIQPSPSERSEVTSGEASEGVAGGKMNDLGTNGAEQREATARVLDTTQADKAILTQAPSSSEENAAQDEWFLRGKRERQQGIRREGEEKDTPAVLEKNQEELGYGVESSQSRLFGLAGVRGRNSKRVKSN